MISEENPCSDVKIVALTAGKNRNDPWKGNEDRYVMRRTLCAVIDGASNKLPVPTDFDGLSAGEFMSQLIADRLEQYAEYSHWQGESLARDLTDHVRKAFEERGLDAFFERYPEARPSASLAVALFRPEEIVVTQIGDVSFRVNGWKVYENPREIDRIHAAIRKTAIQAALKQNPGLTPEACLARGREAIAESLLDQVRSMQNNPRNRYGHGVIDGQDVPAEYIIVNRFRRSDIQTLEIFSDGYMKVAENATLQSWEEAFRKVEDEDPLKYMTCLSTKGSTQGSYTDDRTVLIARFR